jgi:uroporphyrin-III C-methyltransferase
MKGKVYLVGAGPGDPELLTIKALRLLRTADTVLHDDLVPPEILKLIPASTQLYNVGKRCGRKKVLQGEINDLMVALATSGLRVVRLKSGDPLIFGRAGEEIEALRSHDIAFEIVPGVTSALGAAAAAAIPLTHRRASSAVVFVTAHRASDNQASKSKSDDDAESWGKLVGSGATLVIYMPGQGHSDIARKLMATGLASETPCALVSRATTRHERTHRTTLFQLHRAPQLAAPTLLIVGEVVGLGDPAATAREFAALARSQDNGNSLPAPTF